MDMEEIRLECFHENTSQCEHKKNDNKSYVVRRLFNVRRKKKIQFKLIRQ